ncbi:MAG TPA: hypothetical protein VNK49_03910 [Anaerolineales bacterium]|nr:hypothetical protein [Anaerolineales bacterium]
MSTQNENLFVKLVKKSVGLPTSKSDCCGAPTEQSSGCCGSDGSSECCGVNASQSSSGCGCGSEGCGGNCCGAQDERESDSLNSVVGTAM